MAETTPQRFGKYTLLDRIGIGGMAELYRALITGDQGFEKLVAVKRLLPHLTDEESVVTSFIDEAKLAAFLHHRNIVQIYDFGSMEETYFIAMEYLFGKDLHAIAKTTRETGQSLGLENALCIAAQVCEGLDYAHKLKDLQGNPLQIIHRDVSPQNIFISYSGEVKIIDFGIAKASSQSSKTQLGTIKGKVAYMSPEQARGTPIDHRSDIFAAGILLYEMLTGSRMFSGDAMEVLSQVREARFKPSEEVARDLPGELHDILHQALSADPEDRYPTCREMLEDLDACIQKHALHPRPQALALFMKDLYEDEIETEELTIQELTKIKVHEPIEEVKAAIQEAEKTAVQATRRILGNGRPWRRYAIVGIPLLLALILIASLLVLKPASPPPSPQGRKAPSDATVSSSPLPASEAAKGTAEGAPGTPSSASPQSEPASLEAGLSALEAEEYRDAAALFEEVLAIDPGLQEQVAVPYDRALREMAAASKKTDPAKAERLLLKALEIHPESVQSRFQLGLLHVQRENYSEAASAFQKAAALEPGFADTFFNLGYVYAMTREYEKAERMYLRAVELAPMYLDEAYFNLAMVQEKTGKLKESLINLEQALTVNPENELARKNLKRLQKEVQ